MPTLSVSVRQRTPGLLSSNLRARAAKVVVGEQGASRIAAEIATATTRAAWHYKRPASAPARPGRNHAGGHFVQELTWRVRNDEVEFDLITADRNARYWDIQEIGTGRGAVLRRGGSQNPQGRPQKGANYVRTIKSQVGRRIATSLVFATGPGGQYSRPGSRHGEQLFLRRLTKNAPIGPGTAARAMYITREIQGQHFVRTGGQAGFQEYRTSVLAAARRAFVGQGYRP